MSREIRLQRLPDTDPWPTSVQTIQPHYVVADSAVGDPAPLAEVASPLWRGKKLIAACALVGLVAGWVISMMTTPLFRARTSVQLESFNNDQLTPISISVPNATAENYLQNQVKVLESDTLARRVADAVNISAAPENNGIDAAVTQFLTWLGLVHPWQETPDEWRIQRVRQALNVRTSLQSQVIDVFFDSPDPQRAAQGANAATKAFIDLNREAREQLVRDTTDWLNKQAADLKAIIDKDNQRLQGFAQSAGLVIAGNDGTLVQERTRQIQEALTRAEAERAAKQSRAEAVSGKGSELYADAIESGPLRQYQIDLANMRRELAQLKTLYTPTNYRVERLQAQISETEKAMEEERAAILGRLNNEYAAATRLEKLLTDAHSRQVKTAEREMANDRQYNTLKGEIDTTQKLYETVLQKAKETGAESALHATNIRLIDSASVPSIPYSPKTGLNMALGLGIGALGGMGLVLMGGHRSRVTQPGQVKVLNIPELGVIPSSKGYSALVASDSTGSGSANGRVMRIKRDYRTTVLSESFRGALTSILFGAESRREMGARGPRGGGRVLVITSVDMMEGKTTVLTNLGVVAAERRQRVLLIDADLRRPKLHEMFELPNHRGLTDALLRSHSPAAAESLPIEDLALPTSISGLFVLPSGPVDADSTTLLYSSDLHAFLQRCRKEYDIVLVDTPPMQLYADGRILGRESDGVVMVVRANTKSHEEVRAAYDRLRQDQTPVLGTILNDWQMDPGQARAYDRYRDYRRHA